jgi:hypothetical protein
MPVGSRLATNSTKTGVEWVNPPSELPGKLGSAGQILVVNATATNPEWQYGLQMPAAAPGTDLTIRAATANATGKGGSLILQAGSQNTSGGNGCVAIRGLAGNTANLQEWQNSFGTLLSGVDSTGKLLGYNSADFKGSLSITSSGATQKALIVKASSTQTANIVECQDAAGAVLASFDKSGAASFTTVYCGNDGKVQGWQGIEFQVGNSGVIKSAMYVYKDMNVQIGGTIVPNVNIGQNLLLLVNTSNNWVALRIRRSSGQTASIQEWCESTGTVLSAVNADGSYKPARIADSAAVASSLYFSTTANKLVFKDAAGVVNNLY